MLSTNNMLWRDESKIRVVCQYKLQELVQTCKAWWWKLHVSRSVCCIRKYLLSLKHHDNVQNQILILYQANGHGTAPKIPPWTCEYLSKSSYLGFCCQGLTSAIPHRGMFHLVDILLIKECYDFHREHNKTQHYYEQ